MPVEDDDDDVTRFGTAGSGALHSSCLPESGGGTDWRVSELSYVLNMDWKPRYPQPFTAAQLRELDVPTITQGLYKCLDHFLVLVVSNVTSSLKEISRLDNSLQHLGRTQKELHDHLAENPDDEEVSKAMLENQHVM